MRQRTAAVASESDWPIYFVARDLPGTRHALRKGQLFPEQTKRGVRDYAEAFNEDARAEWSRLTYVTTLVVAPGLAEAIVGKGLSLDEARAFVATNGGEA